MICSASTAAFPETARSATIRAPKASRPESSAFASQLAEAHTAAASDSVESDGGQTQQSGKERTVSAKPRSTPHEATPSGDQAQKDKKDDTQQSAAPVQAPIPAAPASPALLTLCVRPFRAEPYEPKPPINANTVTELQQPAHAEADQIPRTPVLPAAPQLEMNPGTAAAGLGTSADTLSVELGGGAQAGETAEQLAPNPWISIPPAGAASVAAAELAFAARLQPTETTTNRIESTQPAGFAKPVDRPEAPMVAEPKTVARPAVRPPVASKPEASIVAGRDPASQPAASPGKAAADFPAAVRAPAQGEDAPKDGATTQAAERTGDAPRQPVAARQDSATLTPVAAAPSTGQPRPEPVERGSEPRATRPTEALEKSLDSGTARAAQPSVRDISLRVSGSASERVEVRFSDRTGDVRLAVRSSDPELTRQLRDGLSELSHRLERGGYQAETWRPQPAGSSADLHNGRGSDAESQQSGSRHQGGSGWDQDSGRNRNPRNQPRWVEELEARFTQGQISEQ